MVIESIVANALVFVFALVASVFIGPTTLGSPAPAPIAFAGAVLWALWGAIDNVAVRPVRWCGPSRRLRAVQLHLGVLIPLVVVAEPLSLYAIGSDLRGGPALVIAIRALLWATSVTAFLTATLAFQQQRREYDAQFESRRTGDHATNAAVGAE